MLNLCLSKHYTLNNAKGNHKVDDRIYKNIILICGRYKTYGENRENLVYKLNASFQNLLPSNFLAKSQGLGKIPAQFPTLFEGIFLCINGMFLFQALCFE